MISALLLVALVAAAVIIVPLRLGRPPAPEEAGRPEQSGWEVLRFELERARRCDQGFALVRLSERRTGADARPRTSQRDTPTSLPVEIRATDRTWSIDGSQYVLLVGSEPRTTAVWLRQLHRDHLDGRFDAAVVHFPDDGLTAQALLEGLGDHTGASTRARSPGLDDYRAAS